MKNFFDYTDEKITEKVFMQSITVSVIGILLCIVSLCSATFAWFTNNLESGQNTLVAGSFDLEARVVAGDDITSDANCVTVTREENGALVCTLETAGTYTVKLSMTDEANVKGYCKLTASNGEEYITAPISKNSETGINPIQFTITTTEADVKLCFMPQWGIPASYTIDHEGGVTLGATPPTGEYE